MDKEIKLLVVDDEERIRRLLKLYLEKEGYVVEEAADGSTALEMAMREDYSLIILDLMLPGMHGVDVCVKLREHKSTPIIMLTADGEEISKLTGFEAGTDDYVVKPFSPREMLLRVKSLLRRSTATANIAAVEVPSVIVYPHLKIENNAHRVTVLETPIQLTPKEYELLHFLATTPDKVYSREELLKEVWHYDFFGDLRTVDTHVKRLREKIGAVSPEAAEYIHTIWGVGYKFQAK